MMLKNINTLIFMTGMRTERFVIPVVLLVAWLLFACLAPAWAITTSGPITGEETWSGTVHLTGDVTVTATGKLTILPETKVECEPNSDDQIGGIHTSRIELIVDGGILIAEGMEASLILFTSARPSPKQKGDWYGLRVKSNNATLRYCTVEYGKEGLRIEGGTPTVEHCTFQKNESNGVRLEVSATLTDCTVKENQTGVFVANGLTLNLTNSTVSNNAGQGIEDYNGTVVVNSSTVSNNGGWAIAINSSSSFGSATVVDSVVSGNTADGLLIGRGTATIKRSTVANNRRGVSANWNGGGTIYLEDSIVTGNVMDGLGGDAPGRAAAVATVLRSNVSSNGGTGIYADIVTVTNSTVSNNGPYGIYAGTVTVTNSTVSSNGGDGIAFSTLGTEGITSNLICSNRIGLEVYSSAAKLELTGGNDITCNMEYELKNSGSAAVIADGNYWGEPTTTELESHVLNLTKIYDSRDNPSVGQVAIRTWLTQSVTGPVIDSLDPTSGSPGTQVTILGQRFGSDPAVVKVTFNGVEAQIISITPTEIKTVVPDDATTGPVVVTLYGCLSSNNDKIFEVICNVGAIAGCVTDLGGNPIVNAFVIAVQKPTKKSTKTGVDGCYEITDLQPGYWLVIAIKKGYKAGVKKVEVKPCETTPVPPIILKPKSGQDEDEFAELLANFPDPFNPDTWLPYYLSHDADVTIKIYSSSGKLVRTLNLGRQAAGIYIDKDEAAYWDGKNETGEKVASGVYFYQLQAGNSTATRKMLMVK